MTNPTINIDNWDNRDNIDEGHGHSTPPSRER
jgi:hypothetical protein